MFEHLKRLDITEATAWIDMPEVNPACRILIKPANESNRPYYNAMLRAAAGRPRIAAAGANQRAAAAAAMVQHQVDDDRELFPRHVIVDWTGVLDEQNQPIPYSRDHAQAFCRALPTWLFNRLRNFAASSENFVEEPEMTEDQIDDLGKS